MTLLNAPTYDETGEKRKLGLLIAGGVVVALAFVLGIGGFLLGHGWFFSNLKAEHVVNNFFDALQNKDYPKAYGIWMHDPNWQQHPDKYDYKLKRFTEDWDDGERLWADHVAPRGYFKDGWDGELRDRDHCGGAGERG